MDVNEVTTENTTVEEEHPFGIEPETYSELETNHPKLYKNTESGTSTVPTGNPFDKETGGGSSSDTPVFVRIKKLSSTNFEVNYTFDELATLCIDPTDKYNKLKDVVCVRSGEVLASRSVWTYVGNTAEVQAITFHFDYAYPILSGPVLVHEEYYFGKDGTKTIAEKRYTLTEKS